MYFTILTYLIRLLGKLFPKANTPYQNIMGNRKEWEKLAKEGDHRS